MNKNKKNIKPAHKKSYLNLEPKVREPEYMVQVNDPPSVRRDLLESLREVIIFMQGYEKFRKIQEEKVATFTKLKEDIKDMNQLIEGRLRKYFPKGKLHAAMREEKMREEKEKVEVVEKEETLELPKVQVVDETPEEDASHGELEELESQLKDIEKQLQNIK